ncbi:DUF4129 domain-containing protein [Streptomyces formicae]|uniref:DUF4129 domain-containing protein n=1 Tax=Streptomyces formicae TaxID=1616117 RepID=A0ABY3WYA9_9ACTN|nr:DUF4129 domain-containing protein [Streptomyces formicae]UNM15486.1 DUF4129 domain-containing protein [Streptomyces formicae]
MSVTGGTTTARLLIRADDAPVDIPRVPAREAAERELSKPMYHESDPNLLERALDRFWEWVDGIFSAASDATPGGLLGLLVIVVVVIALAAALWWRLGTPRRTPTGGDALFDDSPRTAAEHRTAAEAHAAAGRFAQAVQERMRAIVRSLEERALLDPRPGRTADEAAAEAGGPMPDQADALRAAARSFDDVTYGGRTADQETYLRLKDLDNRLERTKPQLSSAARGAAG